MEEEDQMVLILEDGADIRVLSTHWRGTVKESLTRLPLRVELELSGESLTSVEALFEVNLGSNIHFREKHL